MILEINIKFKHIYLFLLLLIFSHQHNNVLIDPDEKYYYSMFPSQDIQNASILYVNNPFSELLSINIEKGYISEIEKELAEDYYFKNISSILLYKKQYLVKTCFAPNKILEILSLDEIGKKKETQKIKYTFTSTNDFNDTNRIVFCYSSIIKNPDRSSSEKSVILTFWTENNTNSQNSQDEFSHKYIFFYPDTHRFSDIHTFHSDSPKYLSTVIPRGCTTFRETDIYCTIINADNQLIIETSKIPDDTDKSPSVYIIYTILAGGRKNMKPISLNQEWISFTGGIYDTFLLEYHNKEANETYLLYTLYRKTMRLSIIPAFDDYSLFGISLKDEYLGYNFFNVLFPNTDELVLVFIMHNKIQARNIELSKSVIATFKKISEKDGGYYESRIDANCRVPKYMQSAYINSSIKYNSTEQDIVDKNKLVHYTYQRDIAVLLSCAKTVNEENPEIIYVSQTIQLPQCLSDLDSLHGLEFHKINFYLSIDTIIYDIYGDPRLKSFRNVGIKFYKYEQYFLGLLFLQIKLANAPDYIVPQYDVLYENITHIKFKRILPRYVPFLNKPFYLKYRLMEISQNQDTNVKNVMYSNLCYFQIKFFPYDPQQIGEGETDATTPELETESVEILEKCTDKYCAVCNSTTDYCTGCDSSLIPVIILDQDPFSKTKGSCICNTTLGFIKEPHSDYDVCICQEDYDYYKSVNLCWPTKKLENGPYYIRTIDDRTNLPIYDDCYHGCKKCSKGPDSHSHNCLKCKDGYAYIDDDTSNCYPINEIGEGFHQVEPDHFIKCHDNCISCSQKSEFNEEKNETLEFCTECRNNVTYMLKFNFMDESFNCLALECELNTPSYINAYDEDSYECLRDCNNGVQPYNSTGVCWQTCRNDCLFLDASSKKCYVNCKNNENSANIYSNYDLGICTNNCDNNIVPTTDNICLDCNGDIKKYRNKEGDCVDVPIQCLFVDKVTGLCKKCNEGYYPLKEDVTKGAFNCYKSIEEIFEIKNRSNYYFNETGKYWDECYEACETCYSYGSENRQRCKTCKYGYHYIDYDLNEYNNCRLNLTPYENCTSTQEDMYKYADFCHKCLEGYVHVYTTDICRLEEEIKNGPFYKNETIINNKTEIIYYPCYKTCKNCIEKGDIYDHKCLQCKKGYKFDIENNRTCIESDEEEIDTTDEEVFTDDIDTVVAEDVWFKLGDEIFYIYQYDNCFLVLYEKKLFLISNRNICKSICPNWKTIEKSSCKLQKYSVFRNMTREEFDNSLNTAYEYDDIKKDLNIVKNKPNKNITFHLTNFISKVSNYSLSNIHVDEIEKEVKGIYNISSEEKLLAMKVDIKSDKTQSRQVEYQFYNPTKINEKIDLTLLKNKRRRLDGESGENQIKVDLPVDWNEKQINTIDELSAKDVDVFDSSNDFYNDNCYQFTTSSKKDVFLDDRKEQYYKEIDVPLCEDGCHFVKYNQDTKYITCQCDYKSNTDNYNKVVFVNNPTDEKFKKKNFLENFQSMKCISKIFKSENLKKNPGFIIMISFIIIFVASGVFYIIFAGFLVVKKEIDKLFKIESLKKVILDENDKQNLFEDEKEKGKKEEVIQYENDPEKKKKGLNLEIKPESGRTDRNLINEPNNNKGPIIKSQSNGNYISFDNNSNDNNLIFSEKSKQQDKDNKDSNKDSLTKIKNKEDESNNKEKEKDIFSHCLDESEDKEYDVDEEKKNNNIFNINNKEEEDKNANVNNNKPSAGDELISNKSEKNKENKNKNKSEGLINDGSSGEPIVEKQNDPEDIPNNEENLIDEDKRSDLEKDKNKEKKSKKDENSEKKEEQDVDKDKEKDKQSEKDDKKDDDEQEIEFGGENLGILASNAKIDNSQVEDHNMNKENDDGNNNDGTNDDKKSTKGKNKKGNNYRKYNFNPLSKKDSEAIERVNYDKNDLLDSESMEYNEDISGNLKIEEVDQKDLQTQQNEKSKKNKKKKNEQENPNDSQDNIYQGRYKAFDVYSLDQDKKEKDDMISEVDLHSNANPPRRVTEERNVLRSDDIHFQKNMREDFDYMSSERRELSKKEVNIHKIQLSKKKCCLSLSFLKCDDEKSFQRIYLEDLKKHHILYYTFYNSCNRDNIFLKLSFFAFSVHLYFGLNTMLTFNLSMAESYLDKTMSKPINIVMNLLIPFIICGLISFIIKLLIMPQYFMDSVEKKIKKNEKIKQYIKEITEKKEVKIEPVKVEPPQVEPSKPKKRSIKNKKKEPKKEEIIEVKKDINSNDFLNEKEILQEEIDSLFKSYKKRVLIYFIAGFILLIFNWYMMTSFCSIYINTGIKLLINSFISLFASFVIPFILGLIPSLFGYLAEKTNNKVLRKIYETINFII